MLASQYIIYCDTKLEAMITYSYENIVKSGSMARLPEQATTSSLSILHSSITISSSTTQEAAPSATAATQVASQTGDPNVPMPALSGKFSSGVIAGISIGCFFAGLSIVGAMMLLIRKRNHRWHKDDEKPIDDPVDNDNDVKARKLQKHARNSVGITTTFANDENNYLSPIERDRVARINEARDATRLHEMDGSPQTPHSTSEHDGATAEQKQNWWRPPKTSDGEPNPSTRWSASNAPTHYKAYNPNQDPLNNDQTAVELSSIRHVMPEDEQACQIATSYPTSSANFHGVSPIIGGSSPLTTDGGGISPQWKANEPAYRASAQSLSSSRIPVPINQQSGPSATIRSPLQVPDAQHLRSSSTLNSHRGPQHGKSPPASGDESRINPFLTTANGGGHEWVSPETAMADGFSAGPE